MNPPFQFLVSKNPYFFGLAACTPLLLLSTRVILAMYVTVLLFLHISIVVISRYIIERKTEAIIWNSTELFFSAIFIAVIDILMSAYFPYIRSVMGIFLPYIFFQTYSFIHMEKTEGALDHVKPPWCITGNSILRIYAQLFGYVIMFLVLATIRELLSYGSIAFSVLPWEMRANESNLLPLVSSTAGLYIIFTVFYVTKEGK